MAELNRVIQHINENDYCAAGTHEAQAKWYVLYTRSRHEKLVESELLGKGMEAFLPKITLKKRWSDRIKSIEEPLFRSYCFAKFRINDRLKVVSQRGVVKIVNFNGKYVPVEETVISSLKVLIATELKIDPYPYISKGDKVIIRNGPFKGLEGYIVEKREKSSSLVVSVDAIAASVKCVVDTSWVDLV